MQVKLNLETISLGDERFFEISIGKRVVRTDLHNNKFHELFGNMGLKQNDEHEIPLYSANVEKIFGYVENSNLYHNIPDEKKFAKNHILWGIDGNFELKVIKKENPFASTDHCGTIKILDDNIIPEYVKLLLDQKKHQLGFDRTLRSNLENMSNMVYLDIPLDDDGNFDYETQKNIIEQHTPISNFLEKISDIQQEIINQRVNLEEEYTYVEKTLIEIFEPHRGSSYYTKKKIFGNNWVGNIPIYSSKTKDEGLFVKIKRQYLESEDDLYYQNCLTWATDGYAGTIFIRNQDNEKNEKKEKYFFVTTDHCGILIPKIDELYMPFMKIILQSKFYDMAKGYGKKELKLNQVKNITVKIPIDTKGNIDYKKQKEIAIIHDIIEKAKQEFVEHTNVIKNCKVTIANT